MRLLKYVVHIVQSPNITFLVVFCNRLSVSHSFVIIIFTRSTCSFLKITSPWMAMDMKKHVIYKKETAF